MLVERARKGFVHGSHAQTRMSEIGFRAASVFRGALPGALAWLPEPNSAVAEPQRFGFQDVSVDLNPKPSTLYTVKVSTLRKMCSNLPHLETLYASRNLGP